MLNSFQKLLEISFKQIHYKIKKKNYKEFRLEKKSLKKIIEDHISCSEFFESIVIYSYCLF